MAKKPAAKPSASRKGSKASASRQLKPRAYATEAQAIEAAEQALPKDPHGLTMKQRRFVQEYLVDFNATQAAIRAGYSAASARVIGPDNLSNLAVASAISDAIAERGAPRARIVEELALIAFSNAGDFFRWNKDGVSLKDSRSLTKAQRACVSEVSQTVTQHGGTIRVKLHNKLDALDKLAKATGLYAAHDQSLSNDDAPPFSRVMVDPTDLIRELLAAHQRLGRPIDMGALTALPSPDPHGEGRK